MLSGQTRHFALRDSSSIEPPGAALAGLDFEHPFEPLHPSHRHVTLSGRLVQPIFPGRLAPLPRFAGVTRTRNLLFGWSEESQSTIEDPTLLFLMSIVAKTIGQSIISYW